MKILTLEDIKKHIDLPKIIALQEKGFKAYSQGLVNVPPVGHIAFENPPGDYHIKYGQIKGNEYFVVKVVGAFYNNPYTHNLKAMQGVILVMSAETGLPLYLLQDEGYLTSLRTAIAGLISAKYLAPSKIKAIGVLGTGLQARLQVELLKSIIPCAHIFVWGRNQERAEKYKEDMQKKGYRVHIAKNPSEVAQNSNLIITTTASAEALLKAEDIQPGTHITALGTDAPLKQELDPYIFAKADICAVDSKSQCIHHGDTHYAIHQNLIEASKLVELGQMIENPSLGRTNDQQMTVIDLTGVAVQDIQIAKGLIQNL
jgi:ornithine cyclodeaminase